MKKTYSKPQLKTEKFTPQEYCNPCTTPITLEHTHPYYDIDKDEKVGPAENSLPSGNYKGIQVYFLQAGSNGHKHDWSDANANGATAPVGQSYKEGYESGPKDYIFLSGPTINIVNGQIYQNVS